MKKYLLFLSLASLSTITQAEWVAVWSEPGGGIIYYDNASMQFSGHTTPGTSPFIRATIYTNYMNAINSERVCYPSGNDCQWKRLNVTVTYDWSCNNIVRLHKVDEQWDSGPTSQSYDRYASPEPRVHVAAPTPPSPGGQYSIANDPSLWAMQEAICKHWPK